MSRPTTEEPTTLDDAARARLAQLADQLIPGGHGLPSASEIGVQGKWIDRALAARPDLAAPVAAALARSEDADVALERFREEDPGTFESFGYAVAGAYLMHPRVRKRLGYPSNVPKPKAAYLDEADMYLADGILNAVIERGPIFRPAP